MKQPQKRNIFLFSFLFWLFSIVSLIAQTNSNHVHVKGYYRSNGTYVESHYRTAPNSTTSDNFSTIGNVNPYTGKEGWIQPDNKPTYNPSSSSSYNSSSTSNYYNPSSSSSYNSSSTSNYYNPSSNSSYNSSSTSNYYNPSSNSSYNAHNSYHYEINYNNGYSYSDRKTLEIALSNLGYDTGEVDGIITTQTIEAIKIFQRDNKLVIDGKFGPICVSKLYDLLETKN